MSSTVRRVYLEPSEFDDPPRPFRTGTAGLVRLDADGEFELEERMRISANSLHATRRANVAAWSCVRMPSAGCTSSNQRCTRSRSLSGTAVRRVVSFCACTGLQLYPVKLQLRRGSGGRFLPGVRQVGECVAQELRGKSADELATELTTLKKEAFNLRFQQATGQLEGTARMRSVKRDIARVKTIINEKARGAAGEEG